MDWSRENSPRMNEERHSAGANQTQFPGGRWCGRCIATVVIIIMVLGGAIMKGRQRHGHGKIE